MTPTSMARLRLVMSAATGLLLIACIVVVWANPQPIVGAHTGSGAAAPIAVTSATDRDDPCDLIIGAARAYCQATGDDSVPDTDTATAVSATGSSSVRNGVLLCSGLAIAAALALIKTAGGRTR
jgi:hypothetical protein